jgi:hypothetical protein
LIPAKPFKEPLLGTAKTGVNGLGCFSSKMALNSLIPEFFFHVGVLLAIEITENIVALFYNEGNRCPDTETGVKGNLCRDTSG